MGQDTMNLDLREMTRRNGCFPGLEWWNAAYGERPVDYQEVLNRLAAEARVDWARWLMHAIGAPDTLHDIYLPMDSGDILPIGRRKGHAFFAGNVVARDIDVKGTLLVAGRLIARQISASMITAEGAIEAGDIDCSGNVICFGGHIKAASIMADNIRAGRGISVTREIVAKGTIRAVESIDCPKITAESLVPYATGLVPDKPKRPRPQRLVGFAYGR